MVDKHTHEGHQRDFGWFACFFEPLVNRAQLCIVTRGDQCGHVEGFAGG